MATNDSPWVLGISASHNGAVCLLKGDEIVVAVQEERLTRIKRHKIYGAQKSLALQYCLDYAGIHPSELSLVVLCALATSASPLHNLKLNDLLRVEEYGTPVQVIPHHYAHAVSAFATSGFDEATVLVVDGLGSPIQDLPSEEANVIKGWRDGWEMMSLYKASGVSVTPLEKQMTQGFDWYERTGPGMRKFRSLGRMFCSLSDQIFGSTEEAGKVMGLAPYGRPTIPISEFFTIRDGEFVFHDTVPARFTEARPWPLDQAIYADLACSAQVALEEALLYLVERLYELCPSANLCYGGGVALNSIANERIIRESSFSNVYIIPAAEDSGPAIGAAYHGLWTLTHTNTKRKLVHDALGREYSTQEMQAAIADAPGVEIVPSDNYLRDTVDLLCAGKNIGWFQGRSEFGPRALGQRSIICDPRRPDGKDELNLRVKHREAFRPFAPVILEEESQQWFDWAGSPSESQYMLRVAKFKEERCNDVPAVVHVDGTGRVQTTTREANGSFHELVKRFHEKTGVPILLNTSFNVMGMPIVETPADALYCFQATGLDYCILGNTIVKKKHKILLGPDPFAEEDVAGHFVPPKEIPENQVHLAGAADQRTAGSNGRSNQFTVDSLEKYVGEFEHAAGRLTIDFDKQQLRATFRGMTTALERYSENVFVGSGLFEGGLVFFLVNTEGIVDRVSVLVPSIMEEAGEVIFRRVPDVKVIGQELFARFLGRYELADETVEVAINASGDPIITAPGQPEYKLNPVTDTKFDLKNTPGYSIEFNLNDAGKAAVAVTQPNGTFTLTKTAPHSWHKSAQTVR